jgi:GT2 family glycosyltransferase
MMRIDLLIPSRDRHDCLRRSLPSLRAVAAPLAARILVCDQSREPFAADGITVLHRPAISGLPAARNVLLAASDAEVVLFLDDDTDPAPDLLVRLAAIAARERHLLAWGPVVEARGRWTRRLHRLVHLGAFSDPRRLVAGDCDRLSRALFGCCFAVRRSAALDVGFDARRPGYALGEDLDFFLRLHAAHGRPVARFSAALRAVHRRDGHDRAGRFARGVAKGSFLRWLARRHGGGNPATLLHLGLAALAAASGRGEEPAGWLGVAAGIRKAAEASAGPSKTRAK